MERIAALVDRIRTTLLEAGMKPSVIAYKKQKIEDAPEGARNEAVRWLESFERKEIVDYKNAISLVAPLTLQWYKMSKLPPSTHEEFEIKRTKDAMFDAWKSRPDILQRGTNDTSKAGHKAKGRGSKGKNARKSGQGTAANRKG